MNFIDDLNFLFILFGLLMIRMMISSSSSSASCSSDVGISYHRDAEVRDCRIAHPPTGKLDLGWDRRGIIIISSIIIICIMLLRRRHFLSSRRRSAWLSDCWPANRECELGSDRCETGYLYPADEIVIATVIEAVTRRTHSSDNKTIRTFPLTKVNSWYNLENSLFWVL